MSHSSHSGDLEKSPELHPAADSSVPAVATSADLESAPPAYHVETLQGVKKVEAVNRVWGPKLKVALWVGVAIIAVSEQIFKHFLV